jgi:hypothetical protein
VRIRAFLLAREMRTLRDVAEIVERVRGREVRVNVAPCEEHYRFYG